MTLRGTARAATIALFAAAVGVVVPSSVRGQDLSCDRGDQEVRALEFRGNRALSDDDLALRVTTTPSTWARRNLHLWFAQKRCLNRDELPRDVLKLRAYYRERGYYSAQVDTLVQPLGVDAVRVVFTIVEGEPLRLASYTVTGLAAVPDSASIMNGLRLREGSPFDFSLFRADMDTIVQRLRNAGYYRATAVHAYETRMDSLLARASIEVLPGKRARFGVPVFDITPMDERGQQIRTDVVRRVLQISPGEPYSDVAIVDAQRNLFQLGAYRHIEVAPLPDSLQPPGDTIVVLEVRLSEDYMRQLDSELGWATLDCGRVRLQYSDKNFLGTARRFEVTGQASKIGFGKPLATRATQDLCSTLSANGIKNDSLFSSKLHYYLGASVRQPRLLGTRWVPTATVYSERRGEYKAYLRSTQIGGDLSATRDVGDRIPLRLGYTIEYGQTDAPAAAFCALFNRCDTDSQDQLRERATLGVASATLARFRTDNLVNPSSGTVMRVEARSSASRFLGTSENLFFNKGTGDAAYYHPLGYRNTLAFRIRGGAVFGRRLPGSNTSVFIPPQERLYAGGPTSVRGFQQNELGAVVYIARSNEIRVDSSVVGPNGREYRFDLIPDVRPDSVSPERAVPLGGNSLFVANVEYRLRDPFFLPDLLQYTLFIDGGDVWNRESAQGSKPKWTPGFGLRALTPVGPVQMNVGFNPYKRENGPLYYNPDVTTLACATPGNGLVYTRNAKGELETPPPGVCPSLTPVPRNRWYQKLVFTFSIGPDF